MLPVAAAMLTAKSQAAADLFVSQVHQTCQCPPWLYSTKTPTPSPGCAFIVWLLSTSTSIADVLPAFGSVVGTEPDDEDAPDDDGAATTVVLLVGWFR